MRSIAASRLIVKQFDPSEVAVKLGAGLGSAAALAAGASRGGERPVRIKLVSGPPRHVVVLALGGWSRAVRRRLRRRRRRQRQRRRQRRSGRRAETAIRSAGSGTARRPPARRSSSARIATKQPGTDFSEIAAHGQGVLRLRQRQRRHQRPPGRLRHRDRADRPGPGRLAGQEADRDRQGARDRRQHRASSSARSTTSTTSRRAIYVDRRRHRARVLRRRRTARRSTWARATASDGAHAVPDPPEASRRSCSSSRTSRAPATSRAASS